MANPALADTELHTLPNGIRGYEEVATSGYFPLTVSRLGGNSNFCCRGSSAHLGPVLMTRLHVDGSNYARPRPEFEPQSPIVLVHYQEGDYYFQGKHNVCAKAGTLMLVNAQRPIEGYHRSQISTLAFRIPRNLLAPELGILDDFCFRPIDASQGIPAILRETMSAYWQQRRTIAPELAGDLVGSLIQLIGAAFRSRHDLRAIGSLSAQSHFLRIRDAIAANLSNPDLSAEFIAGKLGISKSYLFTIMRSAHVTLGHFILEQRLEQARRLLEFPMNRMRSIAEIAYSVGFRRASHFTHRFSERYGESPKAFRQRACNAGNSH